MVLLDHLVVPIAEDADAVATAHALKPHLETVNRLTAVHVIQKGGGVVDKAPVAKRRDDAVQILSTLESLLEDEDVTVETQVAFGTSVADTIEEVTTRVGATAIAFLPRGGSRLARLLSGDTGVRLVSESEATVVVLGTPERAHGESPAETTTDQKEVG